MINEETAELVDALDHIMRTALASRTQTRRLRWIAGRAKCALEGGDWRALDYPKRVRQPEDLEREIEHLKAERAEAERERDKILDIARAEIGADRLEELLETL